MRLLISGDILGEWAAHYLCKKIQIFKPSSTKPFVLGLPTGSTPLEMYKELIKLYQLGKISFKNVITFNMDEYVGLPIEHPQSFHYYMYSNFFNHIDISKENINILNGNAKNLEEECDKFEAKILSVGGMDLIFGGVGKDGHIAFNEPSSSLSSTTRVKYLNHATIVSNSRFFGYDIAKTPTLALTMGIKTIMDAKEIIILAQGIAKSHAVFKAIEGPVSSMYPITALQLHNKVVIACDEFAAYELKLKTIRYFESIQDEYSEVLESIT
ncbi:MAG: glucosamine-6-phosphate deaminase [Neisseriaceae bacterium]